MRTVCIQLSLVRAKMFGHNVAMSELILRPMTDSEYEVFRVSQIAGFAAANVESGNWSAEEALERSKKAQAELLPLGLNTPRMLWSQCIRIKYRRTQPL